MSNNNLSSPSFKENERTPLIHTTESAHCHARRATYHPLSGSSSATPPSSSSSSSASSAASVATTATTKSRFKVGLDAAVRDNQMKWKRLTEINDDNSTAKHMASEIQNEFAALRLQQEHHVDNAINNLTPRYKSTFEIDGHAYERPRVDLPVSLQVNKYLIAAAFIRDGIHGRKIGYRLDRTALFLHELFHSNSYRLLYTAVVVISCSLAFFESPGARLSNSDQSLLLAIDLFCYFVFGVDVLIRWVMSSEETKRKFMVRQPWAYVRMFLLLITCLDLMVYLMAPQWNPYRYSRAIRPFFLITRRRNIRIIFGSCLRAIHQVVIVLLLLFALIGFFGLLGYLLFSDASAATDAPFFMTLSSSMYTMLLIHNCLPYMVKSMFPYFVVTQWSSVFFIVFVLLTNLFLAKLTIAVSYKSYKQHTEKMLYKRLQKRKAALFAAFDILAHDVYLDGHCTHSIKSEPPLSSSKYVPDVVDPKRTSFSHTISQITPIQSRRISHESWVSVCQYLKPKWTSVEASLLFNTIDEQHVGTLDLSDFYQLCSLLSVTVERSSSSASFMDRVCTTLCPWIRRQTIKKYQLKLKAILLYETLVFDKYPVIMAELVVGVLICLSVIQAIQVNNIELAYSVNNSWRWVGFVLLCLFTVEVQLKLFAFGLKEFFARPFCKLDLAIALVGWCFYVITSMKDPPQISETFYDLALAIRSLRILKLLNLIPPFQQILWTMKRILPLMMQLFLVVVAVIYAFAIITQANYGLLLRAYPLSKASESPQWFTYRQEFQVDTFEEALVTLFGVANLAGWDIVMDAAYAMTKSDATYIFFFTYRIAMSNILLPIVVGFLVESFVSNAKTVETTIQTYVEAAQTKSAEDQQFALLEQNDLLNTPQHRPPRSQSQSQSHMPPASPVSSASDRSEFQIKFERRTSLVQNEMFDAVKLSDISRLKLLVEKKNDEIAQQELHIRKLETNAIGLTNRLDQTRRVVLAYEAKIEELSASLQQLQTQYQQLLQQQSRPSFIPPRSTSWRVWNR